MNFIYLMLFYATTFTSNPAEIIEREVVIADSKIEWVGYKVLGKHTGEIRLKEGILNFEGEKLVGGNFIIDMSTISSTDLEGETALNLIGHLSSPDFFNISEHPEASYVITKVVPRGKVGDYKLVGDLTIKGITKSISFNTLITDNTARAETKIDRSEFDIRYGSGSFFENLGDNTIYDEFDIAVNLTIK